MTTTEASESPQAASTKRFGMRRGRQGRRDAPPSNSGAVYGLGMIGALLYFVGTARTGQERVLAVGKAVVWPAILVYRALKVLPG